MTINKQGPLDRLLLLLSVDVVGYTTFIPRCMAGCSFDGTFITANPADVVTRLILFLYYIRERSRARDEWRATTAVQGHPSDGGSDSAIVRRSPGCNTKSGRGSYTYIFFSSLYTERWRTSEGWRATAAGQGPPSDGARPPERRRKRRRDRPSEQAAAGERRATKRAKDT